MAEKHIERRYCRNVEAAGGTAFKFVSPGYRGVPDRLTLFPVRHAAEYLQDWVNQLAGFPAIDIETAQREAERIVARAFRLAELKDTGEALKKHQERTCKRLRAMGFRVDVVDSYEAADAAAKG